MRHYRGYVLTLAATGFCSLLVFLWSSSAAAEDLGQMIHNTRALREKFLKDPHRPGYHFIAPEGFYGTLDPNGAIFWKGRYHLFYIEQDKEDRKTQKHYWAHVSSVDLVHWRHHLPALVPPAGDNARCWTGDSFDADGVATILYWGGGKHPGATHLATSADDDLTTWTKHPANPVVPAKPPAGSPANERGVWVMDTKEGWWGDKAACAWKKGETWYCIRGGKIPGQGDTVFLFESPDMIHWKYMHPFYESQRRWTHAEDDAACPDFFKLGDKYMLLFFSHRNGKKPPAGGCQYYLGRYENDKFYPETYGRMTWVDNAFAAPDSLEDDQGRRIMWAWLFDGRKREVRDTSGWAGTMCLPRVLWLGEDGTLRIRPPKELQQLRYNPRKVNNLTIAADGELPLKDISGDSIELEIQMAPDEDAKQFGVKVCCSPGGEEEILVYYDAADKKLKVDTRKTRLDEGPPPRKRDMGSWDDPWQRRVEAAPFELKPGEPLKLRVFVDKSVVEVFANDRQAIARHIYPARADSVGVRLFSNGSAAKVPTVEAWEMMPSNPY